MSVSSAHGHRLEQLADDELLRWSSRPRCEHSARHEGRLARCQEDATVRASWRYVSSCRSGRVTTAHRLLCAEHGEAFRARHIAARRGETP